MITKSHDVTEERMMDAACAAVDEYGIENLTTKQWAGKANVSEGSLYYHFGNKEDLLKKTFLRTERLFIQELKQIFSDSIGLPSMKASAERIINTYLVFLCSHPAEMRYYQAFCKTKLFKGKIKAEQMKDWSEIKDVFPMYGLKKKETVTELQFFFTQSVHAYAEYLCSLENDMPDEDFEDIKKLLIVVLTYILEEKTEEISSS